MKSLAFWRSVFELTIRASARFPRLVPMAVVEFVDRRFYDAAMRETLRHDHFMHAYEWRRATEEHCEEQRRSFAYGQVAMHNPTITREQVDAIADTMPAPERDEYEELMANTCSPEEAARRIAWAKSERAEMMRPKSEPWDALCGDGPALDEVAGEEHAAVDMQPVDIWPHSGDQRKAWIA